MVVQTIKQGLTVLGEESSALHAHKTAPMSLSEFKPTPCQIIVMEEIPLSASVKR